MYDVLLYSCGICMPCLYSQILCNVDVMISTLQKRLQDALLSLVGPSSSFRIGLHIGRDTYVYQVHHLLMSANKFASFLFCSSII